MKLKYYMRGVGVGILFSLFIFRLLVVPGLTVYTDDDIRKEARKLGMVEASTEVNGLSGIISGEEKKEETETPDQNDIDDESEVSQSGEEKDPISSTEVENDEDKTANEQEQRLEQAIKNAEEKDAKAENEAVKDANSVKNESEEIKSDSAATVKNGDKVIIEIKSGMGSETFCAAAEKAGLVSSASELDRYLSENGYDHRLKTGKFSFTIGMTFAEIAKVISNP